ncbi:hypothetical protein B0H13DRAFT_2653865 [Mycena leptocephala]|nr:hypothetical protein B0H13DRAFT_2653865 [Mycena leptocephala]
MYCQILFGKVGWSSVCGCAFHVLLAMSAARNFLVVGAHSSIFLANHNHVLGTLVTSAFDSTTCCYPGPSSQYLDLKTKSSESQNGASAASLDYSSPLPSARSSNISQLRTIFLLPLPTVHLVAFPASSKCVFTVAFPMRCGPP